MAQSQTDWDALSKEIARERRRGKRLNLAFSIQIKGLDRAGQAFEETSHTTDISESGCRFKTALPLERGDIVAIQLIQPGGTGLSEAEPQLFEIMWIARDTTGRTVGAQKREGKTLWAVSFPPVTRAPKPADNS